MTAAFDSFLGRGGRGTLRYRLMVEGWAYEWVTSALITHADNRDGREVVTGLAYSSLQLRDRVIMHEAALEADGITFRVVPIKHVFGGSGHDDNATLMFSLYPEPIAALEEDLSDTATTLAVLAGGFELSSDTVYHLGTEAIRVGTWPAATRHIWGTQPQRHNVSRFDATRAVYVYEHPPSMEGRRCALYIYVDGEDLDGDGQIVWRGMISRPPRLDSDGLTWLLDAEPVTHVLKQKLAGAMTTVRPVGINHHVHSAFHARIYSAGAWHEKILSGFYASESEFADYVSDQLTSFVSSDLGILVSCRLELTASNKWRIVIRTGDPPPSAFQFLAGSPLVGTVASPPSLWIKADGAEAITFFAERDYYLELVPGNTSAGAFSWGAAEPSYTWERGRAVCPLGAANILMQGPGNGGANYFVDNASFESSRPVNRIYVDRELEGVDAVQVSDLLHGVSWTTPSEQVHTLAITNTGGSPPWIEVDIGNYFYGYLTSDTEIQAIRDYGEGSVCDFVAELKAQSVEANDGDAPFVTEADLTEWTFSEEGAAARMLTERIYRFVRALGLGEVLAEELKLAGHFMRVESDGRIGIRPLPNFTEVETVPATHSITGASILTPADGRGSWPGWQPLSDGFVTTVEVQQAYDPIEDKWTDAPQTFQNADAIATHKSRGKALMSIKPYSTLTSRDGETVVDPREVAERYLAIFSREYSTVTLQVPFKHFSILCGDVVALTHRYIPAGDGTRGVIARRAVCVERSWNLDPASSEGGTLRFVMSNQPLRGYAPAAIVTGYVQIGDSNQWTLTCSVAHAINVAISASDDGRCLEHFHSGDYVQVTQRRVGAPALAGQITAEPNAAAGTCVVLFDDEWEEPEGEWVLEFQPDLDGSLSTTSQRQFVYVAGTDLRTGPGGFAERFA